MDVFELNKKYEENKCNGIFSGIENFKIYIGNIPIILSAPHAVKQVREGLFKDADGLTGGLVEYLIKEKNTFGIIRNHNMLDDPNYYSCGISLQYKKALIELVKKNKLQCLFDIHGCSNNYPFDINIGTNDGLNINNKLNILSFLKEYLKTLGNVDIDNKFKASKGGNISRYTNENTHIPCFQIEICKDIRMNKTKELIKVMGSIIDDLPVRK